TRRENCRAPAIQEALDPADPPQRAAFRHQHAGTDEAATASSSVPFCECHLDYERDGRARRQLGSRAGAGAGTAASVASAAHQHSLCGRGAFDERDIKIEWVKIGVRSAWFD